MINDRNAKIFNHISKPNEFIVISDMSNQELYKQISSGCRKLEEAFGSPLSIVLSNHNYTLESLHSAYVQVISKLMMRSFTHKSIIMICDQGTDDRQKEQIENIFDLSTENRLFSLLECDDQRAVRELAVEILCRNAKNGTYLEMKQSVKQMNNTLLRYFAGSLSPKDLMDMENMTDYVEQAVEHLDIDLLCDMEEDLIDGIMLIRTTENADTMKDIIVLIQRYIDEHYYEDLSLTGLAQKYSVEKSYLSRLFRQETGENLMPYIAGRRMENAKKLIHEDKVSLTEISYIVGYDDYTYFNRVFRKMEGISPRDYRCRLRENGHEEN